MSRVTIRTVEIESINKKKTHTQKKLPLLFKIEQLQINPSTQNNNNTHKKKTEKKYIKQKFPKHCNSGNEVQCSLRQENTTRAL